MCSRAAAWRLHEQAVTEALTATAPVIMASTDKQAQVLKYERANAPEAWGGSVFGYDDVHARLARALPLWRSKDASTQVRKRSSCPWQLQV